MSWSSTARSTCPALKRDADGGVSCSPYSRRGAVRHRRHRGSLDQPAAHAAGRGGFFGCCRQARDRRRHDHRGLRRLRASVVHRACGGPSEVFGAKNVFILDGGLPKWKAEGRPIESPARPSAAPKTLTPKLNTAWSPSVEPIKARFSTSRRRWSTPGRPAASAATSRSRAPASRSGHMPGAFNVPSTTDRPERPPRSRREAHGALYGRRCRSVQAHDHELRLGRHRRDPVVGARCPRQGAESALRWLLVEWGARDDAPVSRKP